MKYKTIIVSIGLVGFIGICSCLLSGSVSAKSSTSTLNAKREYPVMAHVEKTSLAQLRAVSSRQIITFPNAKREYPAMANVEKTSLAQSRSVSSRQIVTFPNAKRENFSRTVTLLDNFNR